MSTAKQSKDMFLIVADGTDEFPVALRYAARRAQAEGGHVAILHVVKMEEVQEWNNVESVMRKELRAQAEKYIWGVAKAANDINGQRPSLYVDEGNAADILVDIIDRDKDIVALVLASGVASSGPGPLVTYFTGKGIARLRIPVIIIPGHLKPEELDTLA